MLTLFWENMWEQCDLVEAFTSDLKTHRIKSYWVELTEKIEAIEKVSYETVRLVEDFLWNEMCSVDFMKQERREKLEAIIEKLKSMTVEEVTTLLESRAWISWSNENRFSMYEAFWV